MDGNGFIGKEIGNYRITREINSGAFGSVYQVEHTHLKKRIVAIKLLHTSLGLPQEREQFVQEAQFLAVLEHPHILPLLDFGFSERQPYLIAQYATGGSLRDLLKRQAPLPLEQAVRILNQVGQALSYAHQHQIIHRDLKPENILFNVSEDVLLADFGIATMLSTASVKHLTTIGGTPPYMAPEHFQGIISKEGDQYGLGCIAYELVTGSLPFAAPDFVSMGFKHLTEQPTRPTHHNPRVPLVTEAAILKAMAKQRTERHADIPAFLRALQASFTQASMHNVTELASPLPPTAKASASPDPGPLLRKPPVHSDILRTPEEWRHVGDQHFDVRCYAKALAAYEQAIRLDPHLALAYRSKGDVLAQLGERREAKQAYKKAQQLENSH